MWQIFSTAITVAAVSARNLPGFRRQKTLHEIAWYLKRLVTTGKDISTSMSEATGN